MTTYVIVLGYSKLAIPKIFIDYDEALSVAISLDSKLDEEIFDTHRVINTELYNDLILSQDETNTARAKRTLL